MCTCVLSTEKLPGGLPGQGRGIPIPLANNNNSHNNIIIIINNHNTNACQSRLNACGASLSSPGRLVLPKPNHICAIHAVIQLCVGTCRSRMPSQASYQKTCGGVWVWPRAPHPPGSSTCSDMGPLLPTPSSRYGLLQPSAPGQGLNPTLSCGKLHCSSKCSDMGLCLPTPSSRYGLLQPSAPGQGLNSTPTCDVV